MRIRLINAAGRVYDPPLSVSWPSYARPLTLPTVQLGGNGAVLAAPPRRDPFTIQLTGSLWDPDAAAVQQMADYLEEFLAAAPIQVYWRAEDDRFVYAWPTSGVGVKRYAVDREYEITVELQVLDPYFYGLEQTQTQHVAASPTSWNVNAGGALRAVPTVTLTLLAACTNPTITNTSTGQKAGAVGSFAANDVLVWNSTDMLLTRNGLTVMTLAAQEWLTGGFSLAPGLNALQFTASGTISTDVQLTWRPRY